MEKFYNSYLFYFRAKPPFAHDYKTIDGISRRAQIEFLDVDVALVRVNKHTGQPIYSVNRKAKTEPEDPVPIQHVSVSLVPEFGALLRHRIPPECFCVSVALAEDEEIAAKIIGYSVDSYEFGMENVSEHQFLEIVRQHFDAFNNSDNYSAPIAGYSYFPVQKEYPRKL